MTKESDKIKEFYDEAPISQVVLAFHDAAKNIKAFTNTKEGTRDVLLERLDEAEDTPKGYKLFKGPQEMAVEVRPRHTFKLNPEKAKAKLESKGLYTLAVDTEIVVQDPIQLNDKLEELQELLVQLGKPEEAQAIEDLLAKTTERRDSISETKLTALVKKGKLTLDEVEQMHDASITYTVYDVSK